MVWRLLREEFRMQNFLYQHHDETAFHNCQWKWPRPVYLCVRVLLAAYTLYGFTHELVHYYIVTRESVKETNLTDATDDGVEPITVGPPAEHFDQWTTARPWFVFFTMWTYMVLLIHLWFSAVLSILFYRRSEARSSKYSLEVKYTNSRRREDSYNTFQDATIENNGRVPNPGKVESELSPLITSEEPSSPRSRGLAWYYITSWLLSDIITPSAPIVTVVFFAALYQGGPVDVYNTNVHVLNTVFVAVDHMICARPIRFLHVLAPVLFGGVYGLFSYLFWRSDHINHVVYPGVLDWNHPIASGGSSAVLLLVVVPLVQAVWVMFYQLKMAMYRKLNDVYY